MFARDLLREHHIQQVRVCEEDFAAVCFLDIQIQVVLFISLTHDQLKYMQPECRINCRYEDATSFKICLLYAVQQITEIPSTEQEIHISNKNTKNIAYVKKTSTVFTINH